MTYGCIRCTDTYQFLSSSLDSLDKTLVVTSHKTLKDLKKGNVDNDEKSDFVKEIEKDKTIKDLKKKDYSDKTEKLEEALLNYIGENDLKVLQTELPDKWKYLTKKLAYPYEYFKSIDDYQKPVDNLKKEDFCSKLKNDFLSDEETERTKQCIKLFKTKKGREQTQIWIFEK